MITAMATRIDDKLVLNFSYPNGAIIGPVIAHSEADAKRLVYFHNRLFIHDNLKHWLELRMNAFRTVGPGFDHNRQIAERLYTQLVDFKKTSMFRLCEWVVCHQADIASITPGAKSAHRKYYQDKIHPILLFCNEMCGIEAEA